MSRSGYSDDCSGNELNLYRGAVESAIRGKRGQALLRQLADALDAMPVKSLISGDFVREDGRVCALGAVAVSSGRMEEALRVLPHDYDADYVEYDAAQFFGVARALVAEIMFVNDGADYYGDSWPVKPDEPERRWRRVRAWAASQITEMKP